MDKIKAEMDSSQNPWIKKIGNYLLSRNDLEDKLNNQNKSLKECFDYILIEIAKQSVKEGVTGYAAGEDDEIYSLAVHYFDEDNLEIGKKDFTTNADGSAELSSKNEIKQLRGKNNCTAVNEVLDFVEGWRRKFNLKSSILKQNEDA